MSSFEVPFKVQEIPVSSVTAVTDDGQQPRVGWLGVLAASWGLLGVLSLLTFAIVRLAMVSIEAVQMPGMGWHHWTVLILNVAFMAYAEGFRGFQQSFSPRVVARAAYLRRHWTPFRLVLAPLFCMAFFHATTRRRRIAWAISLMVVALVLVFRLLPQPWRGVLDAGVVVGLAWGAVSIVMLTVRWLITGKINASADTPEGVGTCVKELRC